jgi:hypothetical protein
LLYIYQAVSGGEIVIPDGETVEDIEGENVIRVLDKLGRVLVVFQRADVSLYSHHPLPAQCPPD